MTSYQLMLPGARRPCVGGMGRSREDTGAAFESFDPDDPVAAVDEILKPEEQFPHDA